jgi:hypothetical protein
MYKGAASGLGADRKDEGEGSHVGSVECDQSAMCIVQTLRGGEEVEADVQAEYHAVNMEDEARIRLGEPKGKRFSSMPNIWLTASLEMNREIVQVGFRICGQRMASVPLKFSVS